MINQKVPRHQADGKQHEYSEAARLDTSDLPDTTRQEFKDETDTNYILGRFGVGNIPNRGPGASLETDFTLDLQQAHSAFQDAATAHAKLPPDLREKYPTVYAMLDGIGSGTFAKDLQDATRPDDSPKTLDEQATARAWYNMAPAEKALYPTWRDFENHLRDRQLELRREELSRRKTSKKEDTD